MTSPTRAIIHITTSGKNYSRVNYSRRMYAIIRRYTPDVREGEVNECLADLTGLRTFFKMSYKEIAENIRKELIREIGVAFTIRVATVGAFEKAKHSKAKQSISTYKEIHSLLSSSLFVAMKNRRHTIITKRRFLVPFLGKVN